MKYPYESVVVNEEVPVGGINCSVSATSSSVRGM